MVFTKRLRDGIRSGRIRCSVRIWTRPHVKAGGRYRMDEGQIVVDSIASIESADITDDLARESGFSSASDLLQIAKHGRGDNVYLIRFHYLRPGAWDVQRDRSTQDRDERDQPDRSARRSGPQRTSTLLQRILTSPPAPRDGKARPTTRASGRRRQ
jgi:hypothetical protein